MKKVVQRRGIVLLAMIFTAASFFNACKKGEPDPNFLGGEWDIPLTKVGSETSLYPKLGTYRFPEFKAVVTKNDQGVVTYKIRLNPDLTGNPDSLLLKSLIDIVSREVDSKIDSNGMLEIGVKFRITSEGYQLYNKDNKPQVIVRYDDPVGTTYNYMDYVYTNKPVRGEVTEKTGQDEWPLGFLRIKTMKVEFQHPEDFPLVDKVIIRANHKFGIVYAEVIFKNGQSGSIDIIPWFMV